MNEVCIVAARRTPIGRFLGALSGESAVDLGVHASRAVLDGLPGGRVGQVIFGNVLSAGLGMNVARQIGIGAGLPVTTPAFTVNTMCGSGMQAVLLAYQAICSGETDVVLCGGTESMSNAPHLLQRSRTGIKLGNATLTDSLLSDGLLDAFSGDHMALTAEQLAVEYNVTRREQDGYAALSQQRYSTAFNAGVFECEVAAHDSLKEDEHPRPEATAEQLADLKPVFVRDGTGTVTAGNASGVNDGAVAIVLADRQVAEAEDWPILATMTGGCIVGCDPQKMGLGPVHAIRRVCEEQAVPIEAFDAIEINEAFAVQTLACLNELQLSSDAVNTCGGAIALGHPIGATGARIVAHLAHRIHNGESGHAIGSLCIGGGMGAAVTLSSAQS